MADDRLQEIEERWSNSADIVSSLDRFVEAIGSSDEITVAMEFIAHAPIDIAWLIDEVVRLRLSSNDDTATKSSNDDTPEHEATHFTPERWGAIKSGSLSDYDAKPPAQQDEGLEEPGDHRAEGDDDVAQDDEPDR